MTPIEVGASVLWDILESNFACLGPHVCRIRKKIVINFHELRQRQFFVESPFSRVNYVYKCSFG